MPEARVDVDALTLLLGYCEAVIRHTATLTDDDHAQLRAAVEMGWAAARQAEDADQNDVIDA